MIDIFLDIKYNIDGTMYGKADTMNYEKKELLKTTEIQSPVKVSVVLPVYNAAEFLPKCLDSLISQTLEKIEIICVNDGSTDDSLSIIQDYAGVDRRIICIDQENTNAGKARNVGMERASGKYLYFPDADDYAASNLLQKAYETSEEYQTDICVFASSMFDSQTGNVRPYRSSVRVSMLPEKKVFNTDDINGNPLRCFVGWAWDKFYRRSFVTENHLQFQEQRTTNDLYFVMASLLKAERITYLPDCLYYQRRNNPQSLTETRHLSWECFYHAVTKVRSELIDMGIYDRYEKHFINFALRRCIWNLTTMQDEGAAILFDRLREEWFDDLGIKDHGAEFYDDPGDYEQLMLILQATEHEGCSAYYDYVIRRLKLENQKLTDPKRRIRISPHEVLPQDLLIKRLIWNREQRIILSEKLKQLEEKLKK